MVAALRVGIPCHCFSQPRHRVSVGLGLRARGAFSRPDGLRHLRPGEQMTPEERNSILDTLAPSQNEAVARLLMAIWQLPPGAMAPSLSRWAHHFYLGSRNTLGSERK